MLRGTLDVQVRQTAQALDTASVARAPFTLEHVFTPRGAAYDFSWNGATAYLAVHDIVLSDGEMRGDGLANVRQLDLRRRMTFFPAGLRAGGWSANSDRVNSFTALTFDQTWLLDELEVANNARDPAPLIYFHDRALLRTMEKLGHLARARADAPRLAIDSAVMLAGAELLRALQSRARPHDGGLSGEQLARAIDFIDAHLLSDVALADIAQAAGLSTFHFVRAFKVTTGVTPYRHLIETRVARAKALMGDRSKALGEVAIEAGFTNASHFSRTFAEVVGVTPRDFRRQSR